MEKGGRGMALTITSPAFFHNCDIPRDYTCDGLDVSPPLEWGGVPQTARSLTLIVEDPDAPDPDAPQMTWVHWILYNLPPATMSFEQGISRQDLPSGTLEGSNNWNLTGYGGPCPPVGKHRYFFRLFALDTTLPDLLQPERSQLNLAMKEHILEEAKLIGLYQR